MDYRRASHARGIGRLVAGSAGPGPGQRRQENIERFETNAGLIDLNLDLDLGEPHWDETDGQVSTRAHCKQCTEGHTADTSEGMSAEDRLLDASRDGSDRTVSERRLKRWRASHGHYVAW